MVGAVDFAGNGDADVTDIDNLDGGETNFDVIMNPVINPQLYVKEFIKSGLDSARDASSNIEGLIYDRTQFSQDGGSLSSSVPQILKRSHLDSNGKETISTEEQNSFAVASTLISEVADLSQGNADTLDGTQFKLIGTKIDGSDYSVRIDFNSTANGGSKFLLDTDGDGNYDNGTYDIFNMEDPRVAVDADKMTYRQLMDVVNMVVTDQIPTLNTAADYDAKIRESNFSAGTFLSYDGKIQFKEIGSFNTDASIALHDINSGDFTAGVDSSVMAFNANNGLTVRDPKTDFFKTIDEMITAIENHKLYPDGSGGDVRNVGIENAISMMDDLQDHVFRSHSIVGAQSNALTNSLERTELLEISTMTLRSSVIDTDLAEASLNLTQLTLNYESMLSTVGKVSKLSLVNYL
jgi:flagellar hook-associated protein 3 FlgL